MLYRDILFDADNTLLDFSADMETAFQKAYCEMGLETYTPYSRAVLAEYEQCNNKWWAMFEEGACSKQALYIGRFRDFFARLDIRMDPVQFNAQYFACLGQTGTPFPGAMDLLMLVSERFRLYIVTNGNASSQYRRIENAGFSPYIKEIFVSESIGVGKPDIQFFTHVFSRIPDFKKAHCILIGDSLNADILGANRAGVDSIWYNPGKIRNTSHIKSSYEVANYKEILTILEQ